MKKICSKNKGNNKKLSLQIKLGLAYLLMCLHHQNDGYLIMLASQSYSVFRCLVIKTSLYCVLKLKRIFLMLAPGIASFIVIFQLMYVALLSSVGSTSVVYPVFK